MTELKTNRRKKLPEPASSRRLVGTKKAAEYLDMSEWKVRELVHNGQVPVIQDGEGSPFKFDIRDLDEYVERKKQRTA